MHHPSCIVPVALATLLSAASLAAQSTMTPLTTFGTNGWLTPGSSTYLGTANNERGFAYNPTTGNLILVSRNGGSNIRVLSGATGSDLGGLDATGITGGTFTINQADCAADGSIYVANLSTTSTTAFKVYKWTSEAPAVPPTVAFNATTGIPRTGDCFAVTGGTGGNPIQFAASGSSTTSNSCFSVGVLDGTNLARAFLAVLGTPNAASNGYRLGMTFANASTIIGSQGTAGLMTSFNNAVATLQASAAQRPMDYAEIMGIPLLAVADSNSSLVSVYDISIPSAPVLVVSGNNTTGTLTSNANGTGAVQWGAVSGNTATLYAMCSNQGIQAFQVTIVAPASTRVVGTGCGSPALTLSASGAPIMPSSITLDMANLPVNAQAFFCLGLESMPLPFQLPIAPGCYQYLVSTITRWVTPTVPGFAQLALNIPSSPSLAGLPFWAQGVSYDTVTSGIQTANGLRIYLQTY
jgi:Domain of unknown function (DUF4623)